MPYTPNATDVTQPLGSVDASTAAAEFRALKAYVAGIVLAAGMFAPVRQCANDGVVNSTGDPVFLIAAVAGGLALDLKATGKPLVANFAGGSTGTGISDRNGTYTADTANLITGLPANNTSYIFADYVSSGVWTWQSTLAPVQYGKVYPQTIGSVLQFAGAAGTTTFLDDFGGTWTTVGGAKVQTNQFKFGTGALGGGGAANALNGTTDYLIKFSPATIILGSGGWAIRGWVQPTALPGAGNVGSIINVTNAGAFGARLDIYNNAGPTKFAMFLSSNGTVHDIANGTQGTTTPVINTWYFVELTYDALAGIYRLYVNGVQEASVTSALKIATGAANTCIGSASGVVNTFLSGYVDKPEILSYCNHPASTVYIVPTAAPSIIAAGYAPDFFDTQAMKMYQVTGVSAVAGTPPTLTQKYRCYFGEVDTGVAVPSAVRNYAFNGRYISADITTPIVSSRTAFTANIGTQLVTGQLWARNYIAEAGYTPGMVTAPVGGYAAYNSYGGIVSEDRNTVSINSGGTGTGWALGTRTGGAHTSLTAANWKMFIQVQRAF